MYALQRSKVLAAGNLLENLLAVRKYASRKAKIRAQKFSFRENLEAKLKFGATF